MGDHAACHIHDRVWSERRAAPKADEEVRLIGSGPVGPTLSLFIFLFHILIA
jgi:hypothetical protein